MKILLAFEGDVAPEYVSIANNCDLVKGALEYTDLELIWIDRHAPPGTIGNEESRVAVRSSWMKI